MYDNRYKCPVNVIQICDIDNNYNFLNSKNKYIIHIDNLDRNTYINQTMLSQNSKIFFVGYVNDSLIGVTREKVIGDISDLTIGDISDLIIYYLCREEAQE